MLVLSLKQNFLKWLKLSPDNNFQVSDGHKHLLLTNR